MSFNFLHFYLELPDQQVVRAFYAGVRMREWSVWLRLLQGKNVGRKVAVICAACDFTRTRCETLGNAEL